MSKQGTKTVGHPVDVASGSVYSEIEDINIPGQIDFILKRRYSTQMLGLPDTPLGQGWTLPCFSTLTQNDNKFILFSPEGDIEIFLNDEFKLENGETIYNFGTFQKLSKEGSNYIVTRWEVDSEKVERLIFEEGNIGETWPINKIENMRGFFSIDFIRNDKGLLEKITQRHEQRTFYVTYTNDSKIESIYIHLKDSNDENKTYKQVLVRYEYNSKGVLKSVKRPQEHVYQYEYDDKNRLIKEITPDGGEFIFEYDTQGRCIKTSGKNRYDEKSIRYLLDWIEVTDSNDNITMHRKLSSGQIKCEISPLGAQKQTNYDEFGRIEQEIDPCGNLTEYKYDVYGNQSKIIYPGNIVVEKTYTENHLLEKLIDPKGNHWEYHFDDRNNIEWVQNPLNQKFNFFYDNQSNLVRITAPNDAVMHQTFFNNILKSTSDWEGNTNKYEFDELDRLVLQINPEGQKTTIDYDLLGNPISVTFNDGTSIQAEYDKNNQLKLYTDANGNKTQFQIGCCGQILERIDPMDNVVKYHWGTEPGILEYIENEKGEEYHFEYDASGRIIYERGFDGRQLYFEYDPADKLIASINGLGQRTTYEYDPAENLSYVKHSDGTFKQFKYDQLNNLREANNADCKLSFKYDTLGRLEKETQNDDWVEHQYDDFDNIVQTTTSKNFTYKSFYDNNGLLKQLQINDKNVIIERNTLSQEIERIFPGGKIHNEYNDVGQLIEQSLFRTNDHLIFPAPQKQILKRSYDYDKAGNIKYIDDIFFGKTIFEYDKAERIIKTIRDNGPTEIFDYDETNNPKKIEIQGESKRSLNYKSGNRLFKNGNFLYEYDDNGRLVRKKDESEENGGEWKYTWDEGDNLQSVECPDSTLWQYQYDALSRRISKCGPDQKIDFVWNGNDLIHQINNDKLHSTWLFEDDSFSPICKIEDDAIYSVIKDHIGEPRELIDENGSIVWSASYCSFGEIDNLKVNETDCPIRFQGQYFDNETGLCYNRFRYFEPSTSLFISQDPIGISNLLNFYQYALSVWNWIDPVGMTCLFRGDDNYKQGDDIGSPIIKDKDIAETIVNHVRQKQKKNNYLTSFTEKYGVTKQFTKKNRVVKITKEKIKSLKDVNMYNSDDAFSLISKHPKKKIRKLALEIKKIMDKNSEILIEGIIPKKFISLI